MRCFPANLKENVTVLQRSSVIYKFSCKCDFYCISWTTQRLVIRKNRHISSNIRTNTSGHCRSIKTHSPPLFITYRTIWIAQLHISPRYSPYSRNRIMNFSCSYWKPCLWEFMNLSCTYQKQFYTTLHFNKPNEPREENIITRANSSDLK